VDESTGAPPRTPDLGDNVPPGCARNGRRQVPGDTAKRLRPRTADHIRRSPTPRGVPLRVEQTGTSLYRRSHRGSTIRGVRVRSSIGTTEAMHFQTGMTSGKRRRSSPLRSPVWCSGLNAHPLGGEEFKTNLIMAKLTVSGEACRSLDRGPTKTQGRLATSLQADCGRKKKELFRGQRRSLQPLRELAL